MSTFGSIQAQVQANCGNRNDDDFLASIMFNVNMIITWLKTQAVWPELEAQATPSLDPAKQEYTLAELSLTNLSKIYSIQVMVDSRWMPPIPFLPTHDFDERFGYLPVSGVPAAYTMFAKKIKFSCLPGEAYSTKINYLANPAAVTGVNSVIPYDNLDGPIACLASGYGWLGIGDSSIASVWFKTGSDLLKAIGIDTTSLLNFQNTPRNASTPVAVGWADPFVKRT